MSRRQYGTGSETRRADGTWVARFEAGFTRTGGRRRISVTFRPPQGMSERAALAELRRRVAAKRKQVAELGFGDAPGRLTVRAWSEVWLHRRQTSVRATSWGADASAVRVWIVPAIGHRRLEQLTPGDVHSVVSAARSAGRSAGTLVRVHSVLMKLLRDAMLEGHPVAPRVLAVAPPAAGSSDRDAIPLEDALALLEAAADRPDGSRWVAALLQGMRQAECLGLTWDAVDLDRAVVDVAWQLKPVRYRHGCAARRPAQGGWPCGRRFGGDCPDRRLQVKDGDEVRPLDGALCLVRPKSGRGRRVVPLVPWMVEALARWREVAPTSPHGLVWPRPDGRPQLASADDAAWYELQDAARVAHVRDGRGRRYLIHEARHTTATLLLEAGVDEAVVTEILGHSSIAVSRGYQHVSDELKRRAMVAVAGRLRLTAG